MDDQVDKAADEFNNVLLIAPESEYGVQAQKYLDQIRQNPRPSSRPNLNPNRFGGIPFESRFYSTSDQRLSLQVDFGTAYNSNVTLAPISRGVAAPELGSYQLFTAPEFELKTFRSDVFSTGLNFNGYFTLNEGPQREFNLQDYRPGLFIEKVNENDQHAIVSRIQYQFELNEFSGQTFANRHSLTTSCVVLRENSDTLFYWTIDYSTFADDGIDPVFSSLDGMTNTLGASQSFYLRRPLLDILRGGVDVQLADLDGSAFAYNGVFLYLESSAQLPLDSWLDLQAGWGYRDYYDFESTPSRNENLVHVSFELWKDLNSHCRVTLFATYDRFDSPNALFETQRLLTGIMTSYIR